MDPLNAEQSHCLQSAGAPAPAVTRLNKALAAFRPPARPTHSSLAADARKAQSVYRAGADLLQRWSPRSERDAAQSKAVDAVKAAERRIRNEFARLYVDLICRRLTGGYTRFLRAEELVYEAGRLYPGLCPTREEVATDRQLRLADKEGVEIAQGDFLSHVFNNKPSGDYLLHSMLRPLPESLELLGKFRKEGKLELGTAQVERSAPLGGVYINNLRYLNAEDENTLRPMEIATDLVLLDSGIQVGLLRGNPVPHSRYAGRRIFSSGLNLTHLYEGKIPFMFYLTRDLGLTNKIYRGLASDRYVSDGPESTLEKPWIAAVEGFAIGGGCQLLLVVDHVIAETGAYFNLPARKEGIIPGIAPLRLVRFVGERVAQEAILFDKTFPVESPEARAIINEVVPAAQMDAAIERAVSNAAGSGVVSFGANRKAIRVGQEPLDLTRQYLALYCREQADCHFSPALVANLEKHWKARKNVATSG
jgi:(3,5-dihydroxyphenyl)acetyl-CoA 1,2-dioxygenase